MEASSLHTPSPIWLIDHNPIHRAMVVGLLENNGYTVAILEPGKMPDNLPKDLALIIDLDPGHSGDVHSLEQIKQIAPGVRVIALCDKEIGAQLAVHTHIITTLTKPVHRENLVEAVHDLFGHTATTPIDTQAIMARVSGQVKILTKIAEQFSQELPKQLATLDLAIAQDSAENVRKAAHAIKGAVANFAAQRAYELALALEKMGQNDQLSGATNTFERLQRELHAVEMALKELVHSS